MLTLKNAMNAGTHLRTDQPGASLILECRWTVPYEQFDGVLSHMNAQGLQVHQETLIGFYATFVAVSAYAQDHGFVDEWQVMSDAPAQSGVGR